MVRRTALTRDRVLEAACVVADRGGLHALSMRSVAKELGVEAMSLYHHVRNKDDLLDGLADWAFAEIEPVDVDRPWREAMTDRAHASRRVTAAHPWTLGMLESRRTPGRRVLEYHDSVLGCLRRSGFPIRLAGHAFSVLDAYVFGFVLTEVNLPLQPADDIDEVIEDMAIPLTEYPYMAEFIGEVVGAGDYMYGDEFDIGLGMILDQLEVRLAQARIG
ncbi:TetR/AcrR family transcriptional regulator [Gordonia malaquae]|uniref:TetR/AcrR family transcriptional regulator n=1 Tax=Gordonia malaquae TaxID=410332 RepID=UPI0030FE77BC